MKQSILSVVTSAIFLLASNGGVSAFSMGGGPKFGVTKLGLSVATEEAATAPKLFDSKDNEFVEGSLVRVASPIKAFHLLAKCNGSYDGATKEFIPAPEDAERKDKCLVLPVGMRGVVNRVYDVEDLGPQHPIVVIFTPGENNDEGFEPPMKFAMHFETYELEVVV